MVIVMSSEYLNLPDNVAGYAMPKTRLSNKGILALSTGIIDPAYEGRVSSILINFGTVSQVLEEGEPFLRITFHEMERIDADQFVNPPTLPDADYRKGRRDVAVSLPNTFLDIPSITSEVSSRVAEAQRVFVSRVFSWAAVVLGAATFLVAVITFWGAPYVSGFVTGDMKEDVTQEVRSEEVQPLKERVSRLENRVDSLENSHKTRQTESGLKLSDTVSREREESVGDTTARVRVPG